MPQAKITVNAVPGSNVTLPINTIVALDNQNIGGEVSYSWTILDQPPGTADALSAATIQNPTFTPKKEGTYLIRLVVNSGLPTEQENRVVCGIRQLKTLERIPAAGETTEADSSDGWATAMNSLLRRIDGLLSDPGIIIGVNASGITLSRGTIVRGYTTGTLKSGLPGQEIIPGFTRALATTLGSVDEMLAIVEGTIDGNTNVPGSGSVENRLMKVRYVGRFSGAVPGGTAAIGDNVFVNNSGVLSLTQGTIRRRVGSALTSGTTIDVWFNGVGGADIDQTPIDRNYLVYGNAGALPNALRVDGTNAGFVSAGLPIRFNTSDTSTPALEVRSSLSTGTLQKWGITGSTLGKAEVFTDGSFSSDGNLTVGLDATIGGAVSAQGNITSNSNNVRAAIDFQYLSGRVARNYHISPAEFHVVSGNMGLDVGKQTRWSGATTQWTGTLLTTRGGQFLSRVRLTAPVHMPHGATVTQIKLQWVPEAAAPLNRFGAKVRLVRFHSNAVSTIVTDSSAVTVVDTTGGDREDVFNVPDLLIDNSGRYQYQVVVDFFIFNRQWSLTNLPDTRRASEVTTMQNGYIMISGGMDSSNNISNSVYLYDPIRQLLLTRTSMPSNRWMHHSVSLLDGQVLVFGGYGSSGAVTSVIRYNPDTDLWSTVSGSFDRHEFASIFDWNESVPADATQGGAFVCGGRTWASDVPLASSNYIGATAGISNRASMSTARKNHAISAFMDSAGYTKYLVTGGTGTSNNVLSSAEIYFPGLNTWTNAASGLLARENHAQVTLNNGFILVCGGNITYGSFTPTSATASCQVYNPYENVWYTTSNMPIARTLHRAFLLPNGNVLVAGGVNRTTNPDDTTLPFGCVWNPATDTWLNVSNGFVSTITRQQSDAQTSSGSRQMAMSPDGSVIRFGNGALANPTVSSFIHVMDSQNQIINRAAWFASIYFNGVELEYNYTNVVSEF